MAEERGPSKAEVALLGMDKGQLKKQMMKAVRDEDFWFMKLPACLPALINQA